MLCWQYDIVMWYTEQDIIIKLHKIQISDVGAERNVDKEKNIYNAPFVIA